MVEIVRKDSEVLVIGGGLAGLSAALRARESGRGVIIVSKGRVGRSGNTIMTRNSMAAVMDPGDQEDVERHVEDTLAGGSSLNDPKLVSILARGAGDAINWLIKSGVQFLMDNGNLLCKGSPGHSSERILTVDPSAAVSYRTAGMALSKPLLNKICDFGIPMLENVLVAGLLLKKGRAVGVYGFDRSRERILVIGARAIILASGGAGRLYPLTTNSGDVTGDGYALAHLAGAELRDMEFIQFHPVVSVESPRMVFSTSPLADGAVLRNNLGEDYMTRYSSRGCMATRDVMARANFTEIIEGRGGKRGGVYIDYSNIPSAIMTGKYNDVLQYLRGRKMIEVAPAAHFMMGGVTIDEHCRTTVPGLYACGEAAGGVHGANRLAGNALTEAVVFGLLAGESAAREEQELTRADMLSEDLEEIIIESKIPPGWLSAASTGGNEAGGASLALLVWELRDLMGRHAGLVRRKEGLQEAECRLAEMRRRLEEHEIKGYRELTEYHQIRLMLTTAGNIVKAALGRDKSIGAHYRLD